MIKAIDRLFHRLGATYGADWDRALGQTPIADAKTVWAHELTPFKHSLHRIAWALENLPDRCPNVIVFKSLCKQAPAPAVPTLPEPPADKKRVDEELAKLGNIRMADKPIYSMKEWAYRLQARDKAGEPINLNQRRCYRAALGIEV
jgi:hypothetical protein